MGRLLAQKFEVGSICESIRQGSSVPRERHKSSIFHPPHINPVRVLTADDMFNHRPGSVEVATDAYLIARDIEDLDKRITRTEE